MPSIYSTSSIPQGIQIYANATLFPVTAQDGEQAVAADTNTLYIYDSSVPGWQAVANPGAAIAIDALTGEVTATGPGVVAATISNAAVTNAKLAAMADNTVKGNKSGAPASPSDLTLSNLQEVTSSVLTITNGLKAIIAASDLTIQVKQSGAAQDGYLSSADWSSFNAKLVSINGDTTPAQTISAGTGISVGTAAGVTTVTNTAPMAATGNLTEATSSVLTISGGTGAVIGAGGTTIQVLQSGAAQSGYLSSTDWNTFNNAASSVASATALSTPSTLMARDGSGETALDGLSLDGSTSGAIKLQAAAATTPYTVKMPSAQGAASTFLQNDGSGNLSWNTVAVLPSQTSNADKVLATDGTSASWQFAGLGSGSFGTNNVIVGRAKPTLLAGTANTIVGSGSATALTTGSNNVILGKDSSAALISSSYNVAIGTESFQTSTNSDKNTVIGYRAGKTGSYGFGENTVIGWQAGYNLTGSNNTCIGAAALGSGAANSSNSLVAIGNNSLVNSIAVPAHGAVGVGNYSLYDGGAYSVAAGYFAITYGRPEYAVGIGVHALRNGVTFAPNNYSVAVGSYAGQDAQSANSVFLGSWAGSKAAANGEFYLDNRSSALASNALEKTNSLMYGQFNATPTSQTLRINAQVNLVHGEKHASVHAQTGTANVITATVNNYYIGVDCSGAAKTVNLPAAATAGQGFVLVVKDESGSAATNNITLQASGAENIDGTNTKLIAANYGSYSLMCSGSAWFIM
jgi:hypothetical protein